MSAVIDDLKLAAEELREQWIKTGEQVGLGTATKAEWNEAKKNLDAANKARDEAEKAEREEQKRLDDGIRDKATAEQKARADEEAQMKRRLNVPLLKIREDAHGVLTAPPHVSVFEAKIDECKARIAADKASKLQIEGMVAAGADAEAARCTLALGLPPSSADTTDPRTFATPAAICQQAIAAIAEDPAATAMSLKRTVGLPLHVLNTVTALVFERMGIDRRLRFATAEESSPYFDACRERDAARSATADLRRQQASINALQIADPRKSQFHQRLQAAIVTEQAAERRVSAIEMKLERVNVDTDVLRESYVPSPAPRTSIGDRVLGAAKRAFGRDVDPEPPPHAA